MKKLSHAIYIHIYVYGGAMGELQIYSGYYNIYDKKINRVTVIGRGRVFLCTMVNEHVSQNLKRGSDPRTNGEKQSREPPKCKDPGNGSLVPYSPYPIV